MRDFPEFQFSPNQKSDGTRFYNNSGIPAPRDRGDLILMNYPASRSESRRELFVEARIHIWLHKGPFARPEYKRVQGDTSAPGKTYVSRSANGPPRGRITNKSGNFLLRVGVTSGPECYGLSEVSFAAVLTACLRRIRDVIPERHTPMGDERGWCFRSGTLN